MLKGLVITAMDKKTLSGRLLIAVCALLICVGKPLLAQDSKLDVEPITATRFTTGELSKLVPAPRPEDVASPRALVLALHASVTGEVASFDWRRFRSLFLPGARVGESGEETAGKPEVRFESVESWIRSARSMTATGSNREVIFKMHIEQFGNVANVFYSHSAVFTDKGNVDDVRRVNSCQMLFDGRRWWITSVIWNDSAKKWDIPADMKQ